VSGDYNINKLRWECRRGIKEVEVILIPFFEERFVELSDDLKVQFVALLASEDVDLFEWLTQKNYPDNGPLHDIFRAIYATLGVH